jgi:hypothetical protein
VVHDKDFIAHETASPNLVRQSKEGRPGPDPEVLHFDMRFGPGSDSEWNREVIHILLLKLKATRTEERWRLPSQSDEYYTGLLKEKYK